MAIIDASSGWCRACWETNKAAATIHFPEPSGCLEFAQYTRPRVYRGLEVPEVLLAAITRRSAAGERRTAASEPASGRRTCWAGSSPGKPYRSRRKKGRTMSQQVLNLVEKTSLKSEVASLRDRRHGRRALPHSGRREGTHSDFQRRGDRPQRLRHPRNVHRPPHRAGRRGGAEVSAALAARSPRSKSSGAASSAAPSCIISAIASARPCVCGAPPRTARRPTSPPAKRPKPEPRGGPP